MCDYLDFIDSIKGTEEEEKFNKVEREHDSLIEDSAILQMFIDEYGDISMKEVQNIIYGKLRKIWDEYPVLEPEPEDPYAY